MLSALAANPVPDHVTEPVRTSPRTATRQLALSNDPVLRAIAADWGGGWFARYDEATGRLRALQLPGIAERLASSLVHDLAGGADLELVRDATRGDRRFLVWQQRIDGVPVWGSEVVLIAQHGRIGAARLRLWDDVGTAPAGTDRWFPVGKGLVPATWEEDDETVAVRDLDGAVLATWSKRHYTTLDLAFEERTVGDAAIVDPARFMTIHDADGAEQTDNAGAHSRSDPYDAVLDGDRLVLRDVSTGGYVVEVDGLEGDATLTGGTDLSHAAADVWGHSLRTRDWLASIEPEHPWVDHRVEAAVERREGACNAWYTSGTINFLAAGSGCQSLGRVADVIHHEVGHGIHHYGLLAGTFAGDISEGSADYISATILGDPQVGLGWAGDGSYIRDIDPDRVYPTDVVGEVHADGLIWASFLWNLREAWEADAGDAGIAATDALFLAALAQGPDFTTVGDAVIIADDDDGDLTNGTPHGCDLATLLAQHGLGPGPIGVIRFEHEELEDQASAAESYPVSFVLADATPDCSGLDRDRTALWWTIDPVDAGDLPLIVGSDTEPDVFEAPSGSTWRRLPLTAVDSGFDGVFPRQLATTHVSYFMEAFSLDGTEQVTTHGDNPEAVYDFRVGDREVVWCEDFETGALDWEHGAGTPWTPAQGDWIDQWTVGAPTGEGWDPSEAFAGTGVVGTALDGDGLYRNLDLQYLRSPEVVIPDGRMTLLAYRRWLTVEDALYDHADLYVDDTLRWSNEATGGGTQHTLDRSWALHELPLDVAPDTPVRFTWTLSSDEGLEFGGWTLDEVCVVRLADVPGHYRVRDLVATDDLEDRVVLTWTNPWIAPLDTLVVVRTRDGLPVDRHDGVLVGFDEAPEPGAQMELIDDDVLPGERFGYAVLVSEGEGAWFEAIVEGDNADMGGVPVPIEPEDSGDTGPDTDIDTDTDTDSTALAPKRCGCTTAGPPIAPLWLGLIVLFARRRLSFGRR